MSFPIKFAEPAGNSDFVSPVINFMGNVGVLVYGGLQLTTISCLALKLLGFTIAETVTASVVATVGIAGCFAIHFGSASLVVIAILMAKRQREQEPQLLDGCV